LLSLSSGIDAGESGGAPTVPTYEAALNYPMKSSPRKIFHYGPVPFQVFGEAVKRKLGGETMAAYVTRRVLTPIGMTVDHWAEGSDKNPTISQGAFVSATQWAKFGEWLRAKGKYQGLQIIRADLLAELIKPSKVNPDYGITFWLAPDPEIGATSKGEKSAAILTYEKYKRLEITKAGSFTDEMFMAAGALNQRLYVLEKYGLTIVRFGNNNSLYSDAVFLNTLLIKMPK
jgi:CubicO group peptidase (beta-lactamase class C family)